MRTLLAICLVACVVGQSGKTPRNMREVAAEINRLDAEIMALKTGLATMKRQLSLATPPDQPASEGTIQRSEKLVTEHALISEALLVGEKSGKGIMTSGDMILFQDSDGKMQFTLTIYKKSLVLLGANGASCEFNYSTDKGAIHADAISIGLSLSSEAVIVGAPEGLNISLTPQALTFTNKSGKVEYYFMTAGGRLVLYGKDDQPLQIWDNSP